MRPSDMPDIPAKKKKKPEPTWQGPIPKGTVRTPTGYTAPTYIPPSSTPIAPKPSAPKPEPKPKPKVKKPKDPTANRHVREKKQQDSLLDILNSLKNKDDYGKPPVGRSPVGNKPPVGNQKPPMMLPTGESDSIVERDPLKNIKDFITKPQGKPSRTEKIIQNFQKNVNHGPPEGYDPLTDPNSSLYQGAAFNRKGKLKKIFDPAYVKSVLDQREPGSFEFRRQLQDILKLQYQEANSYIYNSNKSRLKEVRSVLEEMRSRAREGDFNWYQDTYLNEHPDFDTEIPSYKDVFGITPEQLQRESLRKQRQTNDQYEKDSIYYDYIDRINYLRSARKSYRYTKQKLREQLDFYETEFNKSVKYRSDTDSNFDEDDVPEFLARPNNLDALEDSDLVSKVNDSGIDALMLGTEWKGAERRVKRERRNAKKTLNLKKLPSVEDMLSLQVYNNKLDPDDPVAVAKWAERLQNPMHPETRAAYVAYKMQQDPNMDPDEALAYINKPYEIFNKAQEKRQKWEQKRLENNAEYDAEQDRKKSQEDLSSHDGFLDTTGDILGLAGKFLSEETKGISAPFVTAKNLVTGDNPKEAFTKANETIDDPNYSPVGWTFDKLARLSYASAAMANAWYGADQEPTEAWYEKIKTDTPVDNVMEVIQRVMDPVSMLTGKSYLDSIDDLVENPSKFKGILNAGYQQTFRGSNLPNIDPNTDPMIWSQVIKNVNTDDGKKDIYDTAVGQTILGGTMDLFADPLNVVGLGVISNTVKGTARAVGKYASLGIADGTPVDAFKVARAVEGSGPVRKAADARQMLQHIPLDPTADGHAFWQGDLDEIIESKLAADPNTTVEVEVPGEPGTFHVTLSEINNEIQGLRAQKRSLTEQTAEDSVVGHYVLQNEKADEAIDKINEILSGDTLEVSVQKLANAPEGRLPVKNKDAEGTVHTRFNLGGAFGSWASKINKSVKDVEKWIKDGLPRSENLDPSYARRTFEKIYGPGVFDNYSDADFVRAFHYGPDMYRQMDPKVAARYDELNNTLERTNNWLDNLRSQKAAGNISSSRYNSAVKAATENRAMVLSDLSQQTLAGAVRYLNDLNQLKRTGAAYRDVDRATDLLVMRDIRERQGSVGTQISKDTKAAYSREEVPAPVGYDLDEAISRVKAEIKTSPDNEELKALLLDMHEAKKSGTLKGNKGLMEIKGASKLTPELTEKWLAATDDDSVIELLSNQPVYDNLTGESTSGYLGSTSTGLDPVGNQSLEDLFYAALDADKLKDESDLVELMRQALPDYKHPETAYAHLDELIERELNDLRIDDGTQLTGVSKQGATRVDALLPPSSQFRTRRGGPVDPRKVEKYFDLLEGESTRYRVSYTKPPKPSNPTEEELAVWHREVEFLDRTRGLIQNEFNSQFRAERYRKIKAKRDPQYVKREELIKAERDVKDVADGYEIDNAINSQRNGITEENINAVSDAVTAYNKRYTEQMVPALRKARELSKSIEYDLPPGTETIQRIQDELSLMMKAKPHRRASEHIKNSWDNRVEKLRSVLRMANSNRDRYLAGKTSETTRPVGRFYPHKIEGPVGVSNSGWHQSLLDSVERQINELEDLVRQNKQLKTQVSRMDRQTAYAKRAKVSEAHTKARENFVKVSQEYAEGKTSFEKVKKAKASFNNALKNHIDYEAQLLDQYYKTGKHNLNEIPGFEGETFTSLFAEYARLEKRVNWLSESGKPVTEWADELERINARQEKIKNVLPEAHDELLGTYVQSVITLDSTVSKLSKLRKEQRRLIGETVEAKRGRPKTEFKRTNDDSIYDLTPVGPNTQKLGPPPTPEELRKAHAARYTATHAREDILHGSAWKDFVDQQQRLYRSQFEEARLADEALARKQAKAGSPATFQLTPDELEAVRLDSYKKARDQVLQGVSKAGRIRNVPENTRGQLGGLPDAYGVLQAQERKARLELRKAANEARIEQAMTTNADDIARLEERIKYLSGKRKELAQLRKESEQIIRETKTVMDTRLKEEEAIQILSHPVAETRRMFYVNVLGQRKNLQWTEGLFKTAEIAGRLVPSKWKATYKNNFYRPTKQLTTQEAIELRALHEGLLPVIIHSHLTRINQMGDMDTPIRRSMANAYRKGLPYSGPNAESYEVVERELKSIEDIWNGNHEKYKFQVQGKALEAEALTRKEIMRFLPPEWRPDMKYLQRRIDTEGGVSVDDIIEGIKRNDFPNPRELNDPYGLAWHMQLAADQAASHRAIITTLKDMFGVRRMVEGRDSHGVPRALTNNPRSKVIESFKDYGWEIVPGLEDTYFPPEALNDVKKLLEFMDLKHQEIIPFFDKAIGFWKTGMTIYNPGYYTRNGIGEILASWLDGVNNPAWYGKAKRVIDWSKGTDFDVDELMSRWDALETFIPKPNVAKPTEVLFELTGSGEKVRIEDAMAYYLRHGLSSTFVNTDLNAKGVSSLSRAATSDSAAVRAGQRIHTRVQDMGEGFEDFLRMAHFLHAMQYSGKSTMKAAAQHAAEKVRKYHFDYSDFSKFEKAVMLRVAPFYKWIRRGAPLMVGHLFMTPGKMTAIPKAMNTLSNLGLDPINALGALDPTGILPDGPILSTQDVMEDKNGYLPNYQGIAPPFVTDLMAYQMQPAEDDEYANYFRIATPQLDGLQAALGLSQGNFADSPLYPILNPLIKAPIELSRNKSIDSDYPGEIVGGWVNEQNDMTPAQSVINYLARQVNPVAGFVSKLSTNGAFPGILDGLNMGNGEFKSEHGYDDTRDIASFVTGLGFYQGRPKPEVTHVNPQEDNTSPVGQFKLSEIPMFRGRKAPSETDAASPESLTADLLGTDTTQNQFGSGWQNFGSGWRNFNSRWRNYGSGGYSSGGGYSSSMDRQTYESIWELLMRLRDEIDQGDVNA